jgi:hypothetical protein
MLGPQRDFQSPSLPLGMATQHRFSGMPSFQISSPPSALGLPFQSEGRWDLGLVEDLDTPVRALPSTTSPETISHPSPGPAVARRSRSLREDDVDSQGPPAKTRKVQKNARSIRRGGSEKTARSNRKGGRRGPLSLEMRGSTSRMRHIGACALCFVYRERVSRVESIWSRAFTDDVP